MEAFIHTNDEARRDRWVQLFGVDRLPVKAARPRWQPRPHDPELVLAFDLDAGRLHWMAAARFANYVASHYDLPVSQAAMLIDGWPVVADGCVVVEEEAAMETAVSSFLDGVRARTWDPARQWIQTISTRLATTS